jgi:hypothetical protein
MVGASLIGVILFFIYRATAPAYFRGEVLNRDTPTRVPEELGTPVGLFGIEPDGAAASSADKEPSETSA